MDKTELLLVGSRYNSLSLSFSLSLLEGRGLALRIGADVDEAKDHVRVLGSDNLTLNRHVSNISASCFYC